MPGNRPSLDAGASEGRLADLLRNVADAGPLALAGVVANGSNVLVTVLLAHALVAGDYGILNQLIGLFLIVSTPGSAVIVAVVRRVTALRTKAHHETVRAWAVSLRRRALWCYLGFVLLAGAASPLLSRDLLRDHANLGATAMLAGAGLWVLLSIDRGFLQATRGYRALSRNFLVEGGVRFVAVLGLVALWPSVTSACLGILAAEVATYVHARRSAIAALALEGGHGDADEAAGSAAIVHDLVTAVAAMGFLAVLQNADVLVIGRVNHHLSGSYAAISVASKALCFIAVVLGSYLVPEAAIHHGEGRHALRPLAATAAIVAVPAICLVAVSTVAPRAALQLVFSSKYLGASGAFSTLAWAMVALSGTVVLTVYLLAVGRRWVVGCLAAGAVALVVATTRAHGRPLGVARADLIVQGILLALVGSGFAVSHRRAHRPELAGGSR